MKRSPFTLVEVVVVIVIMAIAGSLVTRALRPESTSRIVERCSVDFEAFCGRVRASSMTYAEDRSILYIPESRAFVMADPNRLDENDTPELLQYIKWKLPEEFSIETEEDYVEVFRFFPDGGASSVHNFQMKCRNQLYEFSISALTGVLVVTHSGTDNSVRL